MTQLHWGGGATYLDEPQTRRLMAMLRGISTSPKRAKSASRWITGDQALHAGRTAEIGFNRISLGVQDFNKEVQVAVNREQDNDFIRAMLERAANWAFVLPTWISSTACRTRTGGFHHTLEEVLKTDPARLSIFNYAHLPSRLPPSTS